MAGLSSSLYGTEGYRDRDGTFALKRMIADYPAEGNTYRFRQLSLFDQILTDKLETPFSLIVRPPSRYAATVVDNILSCGSCKGYIDHNNNCKKVISVGPTN